MVVEAVSADDYRSEFVREKIPASKDFSEISKQFDACFLQTVLKSDDLGQLFTKGIYQVTGSRNDIFHPSSISSLTKQIMPCEDAVTLPDDKLPVQENMEIAATSVSKTGNINSSVDAFIKAVWPYAVQVSSVIGLDPGVLVAQAALETGWGQYIAKDDAGNSSNNLFNIKASADHSGSSVVIKTTEFVADKPIKQLASFKKYPTVEQSFQDYISLIKGSHRYQEALFNAADPRRYADALQDAGYATDPEYANKIISIYQGNELRGALERCGL